MDPKSNCSSVRSKRRTRTISVVSNRDFENAFDRLGRKPRPTGFRFLGELNPRGDRLPYASNLGWEDTRWSTLWYFCHAQLIEITGATKIEIPFRNIHAITECPHPGDPIRVPQRPRPAPDAHAQPAEAATPQIIFVPRPRRRFAPSVWVNAP